MVRAALIMCVGMSLIPLGDAAGKLLVGTHGIEPAFVGWSRFLLGAALLLPLALRVMERRHFTNWRLALRGGLVGLTVLCILSALRTESLPNVFAAFFVGPILSYVVSIAVLGERVTPVRSALVALGFAGVLLVVRPGFGMTPGLALAALAGVFYGLYLVASRWLREAAPPRALLMTQLVFAALVMTPLGLPALPEITAPVAGLVLLSAAASALGNFLLVLAYRMEGATRLAPFVYFQLVAATGLGWVVFGDLPDALTWAGLGLLVGSGVATAMLRR